MLISKTFPIDDYVYEYVQLSKPVNRETNNGGGGGGVGNNTCICRKI